MVYLYITVFIIFNSRGVHPAQVSTSGNPANVSTAETARKNAENRFKCLSIIHNSLYLFVKPMFREKMGKAKRPRTRARPGPSNFFNQRVSSIRK